MPSHFIKYFHYENKAVIVAISPFMDPSNDTLTKGYDVSLTRRGCKRAWHAFILDLIKQTLEQFMKVLFEYFDKQEWHQKCVTKGM